MNGMSSVTLRTFEALKDNNLIREKLSTPKDIIYHLTNSKDFTSLSELIKQAVIKSGFAGKDNSDNDFTDILYERLSALEGSIMDIPVKYSAVSGISSYLDKHAKSIFKQKPTTRETVKRWVKGRVHRVGDYNTLIKICFALKLDLKTSSDFLNKNGFNSFNIRNPLDAVYVYCILNKRPFCAALELFIKYLQAPCNSESVTDASPEIFDMNDTTKHLEYSIFENSSWENDESFLSSFLIPHKDIFTEYSKTAFVEYQKIKNPFFLTAIKISLDEEEYSSKKKILSDYERKKNKRIYGNLPDAEVKKTEVKITYNMQTALKKHSSDNDFLKKMYAMIDFRVVADKKKVPHAKNNLASICDSIGRYMKENRDNRKVQFELSRFLNDVISGDYCLFKMLPSVIGDESRKKSYHLSKLSNNVLFLFPHRQPLARYEKYPASAENGVYIRKAIILMYYFAFAYEISSKKPGTTYFAELMSKYNFPTFINEVNAVLARCRFAPLDPANRFDFLILCSIRQFELCEPDEDLTGCIPFLNEVLEMSFTDNASAGMKSGEA